MSNMLKDILALSLGMFVVGALIDIGIAAYLTGYRWVGHLSFGTIFLVSVLGVGLVVFDWIRNIKKDDIPKVVGVWGSLAVLVITWMVLYWHAYDFWAGVCGILFFLELLGLFVWKVVEAVKEVSRRRAGKKNE